MAINIYQSKFLLASMLFIICISFQSCAIAQPKDLNTVNFEIPEGFKLLPPNPEYDEVLSANYGNHLKVRVMDLIDEAIKQGPTYGSAIMKQSFEMRYPLVKGQYKGYDEDEQSYYYVNGNIYLRRKFYVKEQDSKGNSFVVYYEYGAMCIEKPEKYHEFLFTGLKEKEEEHQPLIKAFLEGAR